MLKPKKLLAAVDFSPTSEAALDYAIALAKAFGASLDVLYVHDADERNPRLQLDEERAIEMEVDALIADHHPTVPCTRYVRFGAAAPTIVRMAKELGADALVLGTRGRHGLERMVLGSVAESVLRDAPAPVFFLHGPSEGDKPVFTGLPKHVLVGVDFDEVVDGGPIDQAIDLAKMSNARVTIAHVHQALQAGIPENVVTGTRVIEETFNLAKDRLAALAAANKGRGVEVDTALGEGAPGDEMEELAKSVGADMILIGTHGRKGIGRAILGSVAESTIRHAARPVLAFRVA